MKYLLFAFVALSVVACGKKAAEETADVVVDVLLPDDVTPVDASDVTTPTDATPLAADVTP